MGTSYERRARVAATLDLDGDQADIAALVTAAHAQVPGDRPATQVHIRIHENPIRTENPWTFRCGPNDTATPVT
ncbi:hypothetical protein AB0D49_05215 [Streptomyces sp. NPDC048290]|uniref:hypothetical protein n=1 Tax=Streptomyces sp. NPDC048290 TaxID=3155811 RepID=UPI0034321102